MPVMDGDIVAVHHNQAVAVWLQYQRPLFGEVEDRAGIDVLWEDGTFTTGIAVATSLDVIRDPSSAAANFEGKKVRLGINPSTVVNPTAPPPFTGVQPSPAYAAEVISCFRRETGGNGSISADRALCRLACGAYIECWVAQLARLDDR